MNERIIVSLTSYKPRLANLPIVIDTIFAQTVPPDLIVLNLAYDEILPDNVADYLTTHGVEIFRVADTKVYKKLIPTLKRYPNDAVITIDDDFLYPDGMIEEFLTIHENYPDNPIGGSHWSYNGLMMCHCGCASLTKACFLGKYINQIDDQLIAQCSSDDIVYAYLSVLNGHPYICTWNEYFLNMQPYNETESYSEKIVGDNGQQDTFNYMEERFGKLPEFFSAYMEDSAFANTFHHMMTNEIDLRVQTEAEKIHSTHAYRLGKALLKPFHWIKH